MPPQRQHRRFGHFDWSGKRLASIARRRKVDRLVRAERDRNQIGGRRELRLTVFDLGAAGRDVDGEQQAE